jgi:hypothetical protein
MPSPDRTAPDKAARENRGNDWPGIIGILAIQLAVLLAVAGAVIFYLDWSSNSALAEFMAATKSPASGSNHSWQPPTATQPVKGKTSCTRRV